MRGGAGPREAPRGSERLPVPSGRPARRGGAEAGVSALRGAARPGRAGVLSAGGVPVPSVTPRVRLRPSRVRWQWGAQVGRAIPDLLTPFPGRERDPGAQGVSEGPWGKPHGRPSLP